MRLWALGKREGLSRSERLLRLSELGGVYVPSLYETEIDEETGMRFVARSTSPRAALPIKRAHVADISLYPFPKDGPTANTQTVFDRVSVEIARGCTEGCRFCQAGMIYRPVREREPQEIVDVIRSAVQDGGYDGVSLTSLSTADYSAIAPLIQTVTTELKQGHAKLSVSSLRAYGLAEDVLDDLVDAGTTGLTFAPEAGSQRMRDVVNKNVTEEQLMETARRVFSRGFAKMKLYFMIGLPTEEDEDVLGIVQTGSRAQAIGKRLRGPSTRVTCSVSTHVPKPHTPFQWCAMDSREQTLHKQALLRSEARHRGVALRMHALDGSLIEGVLARGDRTLGDVLEAAYVRGARFDSWDEQFKLDAWKEAFSVCGVDPQRFLGTIPTSAHLPWDHIDVGLEPGFLAREYRKALKNRLSPPCGKAVGMFIHHTNLQDHETDKRKLVCYDCGVACDMQAMHDKRTDFLVKLGARQKRVEEIPGDIEAGAKRPGGQRRGPPERRDQGQALRLRLQYEKLGRAAFGSHLDLVRLLPRLFRRLSMPLYYSLGFNQRPVMSFGPALSLGVLSLAEYVDIKLAAQSGVDWEALPALLSASSIDGVRITGALALGPDDPKLSRVIDEAVYVAALPRPALDLLGVRDAAELEARLKARQQEPLSVRREIEGIGKRVDVSAYLLDVRVGEGADVLARAGLLGDLLPIELRLRFKDSGTAKASEALEALLGRADVPARLVRASLLTSMHGVRATPMELDRLRAAFTAKREATPENADAPVAVVP
jgi:radical SAM-linked protein